MSGAFRMRTRMNRKENNGATQKEFRKLIHVRRTDRVDATNE